MDPVSVVGLGAMGSRIAGRLLDAGCDVAVWNRSPEVLGPLLARGARGASTPREAAQHARTLITMLSEPDALRSVSEGPDGIAAGAHPELVVVEMSTVGPAAVERLASLLSPMAQVVDAPVLGSVDEAESGTLTIFIGGGADVVQQVEPVLGLLGRMVHVGQRGMGAAAKLAANAALLGTLTTLGETLLLADTLGLSREATAEVLATTPLAEQARRRLPVIAAGVYPRRFGLSLARKDADLIVGAAEGSGVQVPLLAAVRGWLAAAENGGRGGHDYTAMLATILQRRLTDVEEPARSPDLRAYDGLIVDLDGVVWLGERPIDGVAHALRALRADGVKILFVTNDPEHSRSAQAERLTAIGVTATPDDVLTAAAAAALLLARQARIAGARVLVAGSPALREEFAAAGFELVEHAGAGTARFVVVGGHHGFDYAELSAAVRAVEAGAELFAMGRDPFVPTASGREPGTGAILAAIETATGATATITGKPEPHMFSLAKALLGDCTRVAVIGDSLSSDIGGARRAGLDAILVLSGATRREDLESADVRPDLVLPTLAAACA